MCLGVVKKGLVSQTLITGSDIKYPEPEKIGALLEVMRDPEDFIAFIRGRPGHDLSYAINA
jgi:dTDP-D-glucose 4,6-dehydratase